MFAELVNITKMLFHIIVISNKTNFKALFYRMELVFNYGVIDLRHIFISSITTNQCSQRMTHTRNNAARKEHHPAEKLTL